MGPGWQAYLANDYVKEGQALACQVCGTVHVASKAVISTENNKKSITDHSRPYPDSHCCYCIKILITEPSYSCQEKTQHKNMRGFTCKQGCLVSMRNRAEKDAARWRHLTHEFIAGASVHSREPKTKVAPIFCFKEIYKP